MEPPEHRDAILNAFLRRYHEDKAEGAVRPVSEYISRWPEHAEAIVMLYQRLEVPLSEDPGDAGAETMIAHYRLERELGRGGQGTVYVAWDTRLRRQIALKMLAARAALSPETIERFQREALIASRLDHPGICPVYDSGFHGGVPFIVMKLLKGQTLALTFQSVTREESWIPTAVSQTRRASVEDPDSSPSTTAPDRPRNVMGIVRIIEQAARALHAAHEAGIIHRDIKPGNIIITDSDQPVLLDFGLARDESEDFQTLTRTGDLFGTPAYMSPEQLLAGRVGLDRRTDVYSLGATLYEGLAGRRPFKAPTREALYHAIQNLEPPPLRRQNPAVSRDLSVVVDTALAKDRDRRYQTALDLAEDLRRVGASEPIAARPVGPAGRVLRWARRRPALAALTVVVAVALPTIGALVAYAMATRPEIERQRNLEAHQRDEALMAAAFQELVSGDRNIALGLFGAILGRNATSIEALSGKAWCLLQTDRAEEVLKLLDGDPAGRRPRALEQARVAANRQLGRFQEADRIEAALPLPTTPEDDFLEGMDILRSSAGTTDKTVCQKAFQHIQWAITASREARLAYHVELARSAPEAVDPETCRKIARTLTSLWPGEPMALAGAAHALKYFDVPGAEVLVRKATALCPGDARTHRNLAFILVEKRDWAGVVEACRRSLVIENGNFSSWGMLAVGLSGLGSHDEAVEAALRSVHFAPRNFVSYGFLSDALLAAGRPEDAAPAARRAIELKPDSDLPHHGLGVALERTGRSDEALVEFKRAADLNPRSMPSQFSYGRGLQRLGREDEAMERYQRVLELDHRHPDAHCNLGNLLRKRGRFREALEHLERGHETALTLPSWNYPSARWVEECRHEVALEEQAEAIGKGGASPADPGAIRELLKICRTKRWHVAESRLWSVFAERHPEETAETDREPVPRAAAAAASAGTGGGADGATETDRSGFRRQALALLQKRLALLSGRAEEGRIRPDRLRAILESWVSDGDLSNVREAESLAKLEGPERQVWEVMWGQVRKLIEMVE